MRGQRTEYLGNNRWKLLEPFRMKCGPTVPAGFVTDFDSVPRIPIFHAWLKGRAISASIPHDWAYRNGMDRKQADRDFRRNMQHEGVRKRYRVPIYWAVRLFGRPQYTMVRRSAQNE